MSRKLFAVLLLLAVALQAVTAFAEGMKRSRRHLMCGISGDPCNSGKEKCCSGFICKDPGQNDPTNPNGKEHPAEKDSCSDTSGGCKCSAYNGENNDKDHPTGH